MDDLFRQQALDYHRYPQAGKIQVSPTKALGTQRDLALAYSPGVAAACEEIAANPIHAFHYTARGNLVAVITNGTAVLGLGDIGPLASKPVMEGKGVLFKKFAGIDVFDIEISENDPDKLVDIIAALEPTFGGINLEDIKAPECFYIEKKLRERMKIPVFHDDQHGTAIITAAAVLNGLRLLNKNIAQVRLAVSGAGAAAIACLDLLVALGVDKSHIVVCDSKGVIYKNRDNHMDVSKQRYAIEDRNLRTLADAMHGADIFLGLSGPRLVSQDMVKTMAAFPLIFALANPEPEIMPPLVKEVRPDAIIGTGRSDFPNQINNVLCFPFIFRGALDVGATTINEEMKLAAVHAIADLALVEQSDVVASAYENQELSFGPEYLIPKPFDPRLIIKIAPAVAEAAMRSGVATRPIDDLSAYIENQREFVYKTNLFMKPVFSLAKQSSRRVVLAEGEDERVLHATQEIVNTGLAYPILIGRTSVIEKRIQRLGLRIRPGIDFELVNNESDPRFAEYWSEYYQLMKRRGVSQERARRLVISNTTLIAALMVRRGEADALICGTFGTYLNHFEKIRDVIGYCDTHHCIAGSMNALMLPSGNVFIADTYVNPNPNAHELAQITLLAADSVSRFGLVPKIALLSHSSFGTREDESAQKMRSVLKTVQERMPHLEIDGEMQGDAALSEHFRNLAIEGSQLQGSANLLIMPNIEAANISYNLLRVSASDGLTIGPILLGMRHPAHIVTPFASVRRIVNMVAVAAAEASASSS
jgi:malate dehydrogenase (oxaloacetate-decarboxylating)(NADP+)